MKSIFNYFETFVRLSSESKNYIASFLEFDTLKKGDLLWKTGEKCNNLYFVTSGVVRLFFYNEKGEEHTVHFVNSNKFIADLDSLNSQTPSSVSCVAATDCEIIIITHSVLNIFNKEIFEWDKLCRKITERTLFDKIKIRDQIFQNTAKERYISFLEHFPTIANNVQASHIASYLGISQFTLSHIKKELTKKDFLRISKN
ncbi:Crp/Fnr family transcriptional regulator [Flavobacterium sp. J27]|uniref:Crp/Fnr family transcriptional regulator n=1 Tax=Flavobacterium sp. J27 TaxID=2060419 RepID=UPI001031BC3E|nr:Crp/Fnr family transcriptional regulator [Flavobacterium sp. J27]